MCDLTYECLSLCTQHPSRQRQILRNSEKSIFQHCLCLEWDVRTGKLNSLQGKWNSPCYCRNNHNILPSLTLFCFWRKKKPSIAGNFKKSVCMQTKPKAQEYKTEMESVWEHQNNTNIFLHPWSFQVIPPVCRKIIFSEYRFKIWHLFFWLQWFNVSSTPPILFFWKSLNNALYLSISIYLNINYLHVFSTRS